MTQPKTDAHGGGRKPPAPPVALAPDEPPRRRSRSQAYIERALAHRRRKAGEA